MRWEDKGQGRFRKNLSGELEYESFVPAPLDDGRQKYRAFLYEEYLSILRQGSDPL